jgi:hypothetical protein
MDAAFAAMTFTTMTLTTAISAALAAITHAAAMIVPFVHAAAPVDVAMLAVIATPGAAAIITMIAAATLLSGVGIVRRTVCKQPADDSEYTNKLDH